MKCSVNNCSSILDENLTFFKFPEPKQHNYHFWIKFCCRADDWKIDSETDHLCEKHFRDEDINHVSFKKALREGALPQLAPACDSGSGNSKTIIKENSCRVCLDDEQDVQLHHLFVGSKIIADKLYYATSIKV